MARNNYTVELLITGASGCRRTANCYRSGWDMTQAEACRSAVDFARWRWTNVAHAKPVRVHIEGKGWTDAEA